ncbi:MAG: hypothetical protein CL927_18595 [Deltaproteobacteria bacterium]|nr:hypothetical protein [Deltaproteobacteria bacterium]HCH62583.1 hypothetical protein [Deltaproteobacteria bacterium]
MEDFVNQARSWTLLAVLTLSLGCKTEEEAKQGDFIQLSPRESLIRLSIDLRGSMPSEAELQAIEANPALYEAFVDRYLDDPALAETVANLMDQRLLMRTGGTYDLMAPGYSAEELRVAVNNEQAALVRRIVDNDLPWSEIVTADYTMANPVLAEALNLDYPTGARGWEKAKYTDGRQHAGILTMSTTWLRYPSAGGNANRSRANAVSKMLLCDDYLSRPIVLNRAAVDQLTVDPETAISTNASCQSCHSTLDPLAAHFFGFFVYDDDDPTEGGAATYRPEREEGWRYYSNKSPGYYGTPTGNLEELGALVAEDQRFVDCAVQTVWEGLTQRTMVGEDWQELSGHTDVFMENGLRLKPLLRSIVNSEEYLAKYVLDEALSVRMAGVKTASPQQLSNIVAHSTGFRWEFGGRDLLTDQGSGVPVLLGGIDSLSVQKRSYNPSVGTVFVQKRLAYAAAWHVVERDFAADNTQPELMKWVLVEDTPDSNPEGFEEQIRQLYLHVTGVPLAARAPEPAGLVTLWRQVHSVEGSPKKAWASVITAVLRDPTVIAY